jgi:hypothetical protein
MEQEPHVVDIFRPEDAEGVVQLFRSVYGEGYPAKHVYNPDQLIAAFEKKENIPVVARTPEGKIVGYVALFTSTPNPKLYEAGQGLVLPEYRSLGISSAINSYLYETVGNEFGLDGIFGEPVCNHVYMQKTCIALKCIETAIEVDLMPAESYTKEGSASGRVAVLGTFRIHRPLSIAAHIPEIYQEQSRYIYDGLNDPRTLTISSGELPDTLRTEISCQVFDFAKVARLSFLRTGHDLENVLNAFEKDLSARHIIVIQAWLRLSEPWVGDAVELLRKRGYFFGGILPRWFGEDGMLMQKVTVRPNWEGITLYTDRARQILELVRNDWADIDR